MCCLLRCAFLQITTLQTKDKFILCVAFSVDSRLIATGGLDGLVNVFDVAQKKLLQKLTGHAKPIRSIKFSPDCRLLYTASDDMRINVYDV